MLEPSLKSFPTQDEIADSATTSAAYLGEADYMDAPYYSRAYAEESAAESTGLLPLPAALIDTTFPLPAIETHEQFHPRETHQRKRTITTAQLVLFTYSVQAAGPLYTIIGCFVALVVWCLPQAIMSAELSMMMTENGGCVIWVQHAFGDMIGYVNAQTNLLAWLISQSLFLQLFISYLSQKVYFDNWASIVVNFLFICLIFNLNMIGTEWISKLSVFFMVFLFSPFVAELIYTIVHPSMLAPWDSLVVIPPAKDIHWGLFISTLVWSNGGYDLIGSMVGEVKDQGSFILGVIGAFPLGLINYIFPIILCYLVFPQWQLWDSSMFAYIATKFFPNWLGIWMIAATCISNFGPFNSITAPLSRSVWAMAVGRDGGLGEHRYLPYFMSWSIQKPSGELIPIASIFFCCLVPFAFSLFDLTYVFQVFLVVRLCTLHFEYFALIYLKYSEPDTPRPFRIPGGIFGAVLLMLPTNAISLFALINSDKSSLLSGLVAIIVIVLSYGVKLIWVWATHRFNCCLYKRESSRLSASQDIQS